MADVFISYRNLPERRALVRRLATILRVYGVEVWWDYGLEAGDTYREQILAELAKARVVAPMWCEESVGSQWVVMEAELGKDKLVPARLQKVVPPAAFEAIQAADLIGWDGAIGSPRVQTFVARVCQRLGKSATAPADTLEDLAALPPLPPLPEIVRATVVPGGGPGPAGPGHDYGFWKGEWEAHGRGEDLIELRAIADHAPEYFAAKARARIAEIEAARAAQTERERVAREAAAQAAREAEAARRRAEEERRAREVAEQAEAARFAAEGRLWVPAPVVQGAPARTVAGRSGGWFQPGAGGNEWFRDHPNGPELVVVPAGSFLMGSKDGEGVADERPQHKVTIAQPFAVGRFAVTVGEFAAFVDATKRAMPDEMYTYEGGKWEARRGRSFRNPGFAQTDRHPVVGVDWEDATAYCTWLSQVTGQTYRLLSEAEWEYACRAGTTTTYHSGDDEKQLGAHAWYTENSGSKSHPVGEKSPNAWGLHDLHGNVWEWCMDTWHDSYASAPSDGSAWTTGGHTSQRVVRGGSWYYPPVYLRAANRGRYAVDLRYGLLGFRVGRVVFPLRPL